jgi:hypothetical protein
MTDLMSPIASYRFQSFDSQGEFTLYTDRLVSNSSNVYGTRHEGSYLLSEIKAEPESYRLWNRWHRFGLIGGFLGVMILSIKNKFPPTWQDLIFWHALALTLVAAACFFGNRRYEHWRMFRMSDQRVLWIFVDRKNPEACERFVKQLNEAILASRKAPDGE